MMSTVERTWGELQTGDKILDKTNTEWTVTAFSPNGDDRVMVSIVNEVNSFTVARPAFTPVRVVVPPEPESAADTEAAVAAVHDADPSAQVIEHADHEPETFTLPPITRPLELRAHLYLVHRVPVRDLTDPEVLSDVHEKLHTDGTLTRDHVHEEPAT